MNWKTIEKDYRKTFDINSKGHIINKDKEQKLSPFPLILSFFKEQVLEMIGEDEENETDVENANLPEHDSPHLSWYVKGRNQALQDMRDKLKT